MELSYDWKSFQSLFKLRRHSRNNELKHSIFLVTDKQVIVSACAVESEGEDFSDWLGATREEMEVKFPHRKFVVFEKDQADQWMNQCVVFSHYHDQAQYLKKAEKTQLFMQQKKRAVELPFQSHFLLDAIPSWWKKCLPSSFGIYIQLDKKLDSSLLLMVQRGKVSSFYVPDLSSMSPERIKYPADVVGFLTERHGLFVQGLFLSSSEWREWSISPNPWEKIFVSLKSNHGKLVPFKAWFFLLVALKVYFKI